MIKTFRGMLADNEQEKIRLSTKKGKIGYRIVEFKIMPNDPFAGGNSEHIVKVFKIEQSSVTAEVDFSDGNLLASAMYANTSSGYLVGATPYVIFEQEIFNQDIYITHIDNGATSACNYYLEVETINLTDNAAAVSTLRDIRLNPQVGA
jgi:hypothetical protein